MSHFRDHGESYRPELPPYSLPLAHPTEKSSIPPLPQPAKGAIQGIDTSAISNASCTNSQYLTFNDLLGVAG